jgi:hypothetical protein
MARKSVNTTPVNTTPAKGNREYTLDRWVEGLNDTTASNTRRVYCGGQAIVRLCKDAEEQGTPAEDAAYLADLVKAVAALAGRDALLADAKAGKGVSEVAKRQNAAAAIASRDAIIADLMARLAAATPPATPPATPKRRKAAV